MLAARTSCRGIFQSEAPGQIDRSAHVCRVTRLRQRCRLALDEISRVLWVVHLENDEVALPLFDRQGSQLGQPVGALASADLLRNLQSKPGKSETQVHLSKKFRSRSEGNDLRQSRCQAADSKLHIQQPSTSDSRDPRHTLLKLKITKSTSHSRHLRPRKWRSRINASASAVCWVCSGALSRHGCMSG